MLGYKVNIKNESTEIELNNILENDKSSVIAVTFSMNSINDSKVRNRDDDVRCEFVIEGKITETNKDETKKLTEWSKDNNKDTMYRDVDIKVYNSNGENGKVLRTYQVMKMFVLDYEEFFGKKPEDNSSSDTNDIGYYRLFIAQKEGNNPIQVFSY